MKDSIVNFINKYEDLIDSNEWEEVYTFAQKELIMLEIGQLTFYLLEADIHPEDYLTELPEDFLCNSDIKEFTIPDSITSIGNDAFRNCRNLMSITIPNGVMYIGERGFVGCSNLTDIVIPDSVTDIGNLAFSNCCSLTSVTISEGVTSIGDGMFHDCTGLTSIEIPKGVTSIGSYAFYNCTNLTTVIIRNPEIEIAADAFIGCQKLTIQFDGTMEQWKTISYRKFRNALYTCKCIDGIIKKTR